MNNKLYLNWPNQVIEKKSIYRYTAYGLTIESDLWLPELTALDAETFISEADVTIHIEKINRVPFETNALPRNMHAAPEAIHLFWQGVGLFLIRQGREMIIDPAPEVEARVLRLFALSAPFALLLQQRRRLTVLHASSVVMAGQAVAFVAHKGVGKTTLAATLHTQGYRLLTDDILAVDQVNGYPLVPPGFPQFKLWPNTAQALGQTPERLPRLRPEVEKRGYRVTTGFTQEIAPLEHLYLLKAGTTLKSECLNTTEALFALMPHWYGARFGPELLQALSATTHFRQCANLVNQVKVRRLTIPRSLSSLSVVVQQIEQEVVEA